MYRSILNPRSIAVGLGIWLAVTGEAGFAELASQQAQVAAPDETRFTKEVLVEGAVEPFQLEFDERGRVYWIERTSGNVKRLDESTGQVTLLGAIPNTVVGEGGLIGFLLDRDFETSRQMFFAYTQVENGGAVREARVSRFNLGRDDRIDLASEIVVLRFPAEQVNHIGGGMAWDAQGNLYLTVGDNTRPTQYSPQRFNAAGGAAEDGMRTSANSNDLRGKILRIHPEPDGTYTIPAGNLFPPGTPNTRPEIYTMGNRQPWRVSIDSRTGYLHWGEIGTDAGRDSAGVGPMGYDEFNVARRAGNFGWPMFSGYNRGYDRFDHERQQYMEPFDAARPVNLSPNNQGLRELPPAQPALIAYPYGVSEEYPELASGGRAAVGGPIFHRADFGPGAQRVFPAYYEGKWFIVDYVRNWIFAVTMTPESDRVVSIERFARKLTFLNPIDMAFGPSGDLYVVEYSRTNGKISKIEFNGGNRPPQVTIGADRIAGAAPLRVSLSSAGTVDHDHDELRYEWVVTPEAGGTPQRFTTANPTVTLNRSGAYRANLTARDPGGATGSAELRIVAGNEPPRVTIDFSQGNRSFYFPNAPIHYRVSATDHEDGGDVLANVQVTTEFVPSGLTPGQAEEVGALGPDAPARHLQALAIIAGSDCSACHTEQTRLVGPAFVEIADRYRAQEGAADQLARKIIAGGSGVWGQSPMPPHPTLTPVEAEALAEYVLAMGSTGSRPTRVTSAGTFTPPSPPAAASGNNPGRVVQVGSYIMRAAYTDRGANGALPITGKDVVLLRQPKLAPEWADIISEGTHYSPSVGDPGFVILRSGSHIGYRGIDLTRVDSIAVGVLTRFYSWTHFIGGTVEVRLDSPTGPLLGAPIRVIPPATPPPAPVESAPRTQDQGAGQGQQAGQGQAQPAPANPRYPTVLGANLEKPVNFPVGGVSGRRDVYVVFRNESARPADALFLVTHVEFRPGAGVADPGPVVNVR